MEYFDSFSEIYFIPLCMSVYSFLSRLSLFGYRDCSHHCNEAAELIYSNCRGPHINTELEAFHSVCPTDTFKIESINSLVGTPSRSCKFLTLTQIQF